MTISILHPSRNRADKAHKAILQWLEMSSKKHKIQYILSLDNDESQLNEYMEWLNHLEQETIHPSLTVSHIRGVSDYVVAATNRAAKIAIGDVFIFMADDFEAPENWDCDIINEIHKAIHNKSRLAIINFQPYFIREVNKVALLVDDNCNKNYNLLTLPIITKEIYQENGYFFHPLFKSMWCDNFIYEQVKRKGYLVDARQIVFSHIHPCNPNENLRSEMDETYLRSNNEYENGKKIFDKLMSENNWQVSL